MKAVIILWNRIQTPPSKLLPIHQFNLIRQHQTLAGETASFTLPNTALQSRFRAQRITNATDFPVSWVWMSECSQHLRSNEVIGKETKENKTMEEPQRGCRAPKNKTLFMPKDERSLRVGMTLYGISAFRFVPEPTAFFIV
jgi:hypothetical protein